MIILQTMYNRYEKGKPRLSLYLRVAPDADGHFQIDKAPPGDRMAYLQYEFRTSRGGYPTSHGVPVEVKPGETSDVTIGGTGRTVLGKNNRLRADARDIDLKRDIHQVSLRRNADPGNEPSIPPPKLRGAHPHKDS